MIVVGLVLLVLCLLFLVAFSLELLYLLWCRRRRRNHNLARSGSINSEQPGRPAASDVPGAPTKEAPSSFWLCLLCCKWKRAPTRIEPSSTASFATRQQLQQLRPETGRDYHDDDAELAKARGHYASRELFTIREEEEGTETDSAAGSGRPRPPFLGIHSSRSGGHDLDGATPFVTPCESPLYLTPVSSPPHHAAAASGGL